MKVPKHIELHRACGVDTDDYQFSAIHRLPGRVVACDGIVAASVLIEGVDPAEGPIDPRAWAEASRGASGVGEIRETGVGQMASADPAKPSKIFRAPTAGTPPPVEDLFRETAAAYERAGEDLVLMLDAEALYRLSQAIGGQAGVRIRIPISRSRTGDVDAVTVADSLGILVSPIADSSGAEGLILPIVGEDICGRRDG